MIKLYNLIKASEMENKEHSVDQIITILDEVFNYIEAIKEKDNTIKTQDIIQDIMESVKKYLNASKKISIRYRTIEYYLSTKFYSLQEYNLDKAYEEVCKQDKKGEIDILNLSDSDLEYSYNLQDNMKKFVLTRIQDVRRNRKEAEKIMKQDPKVYRMIMNLLQVSSKEFERIIKKFEPETQEFLKNVRIILTQKESQLVQSFAKECTETSIIKLKKECIDSITESVNLIDKFGLMKHFIKLNNNSYKQLYMNKYEYSYEEVMNLLSKDNLKKLNAETLILLSAFWNNRANKIIKDLNICMYLIKHPELIECKETENNLFQIMVEQKNIENVALKIKVLHKIYFNLFSEIEKHKLENVNEDSKNDNDNDDNAIDIKNEFNVICDFYKKHYEEYFDKLLPEIDNSIEKDLKESLVFENAIFNSYKIKNINVQAVLISLLNNTSKKVENFGYIPEDDIDITKKKYILIGIDMKGENMPLRLHINRQTLIDVMKGMKNGSTLFPIYKGNGDFNISENKVLPAYIYVPMSEEKEMKLKEIVDKVDKRDRYGKTIKHLYFLTSKGKMPEHMKKYRGKEFIDIEKDENEIDLDR